MSGKVSNPDWMKDFQPERKGAAQRLSGESDELYELKCLNRTDINMIKARKWFDRPPYYVQKRKSEQDLGFNPYQE